MPFLHTDWWHLISNSPTFIVLGWAVLLAGVRSWAIVTAFVVVVGGLATWLVAPSGLIVGSSAVIFGWLGYLLARAFFSRKVSGSMPSFCARSSIRLSTANEVIGAPGARYAATFGRLLTTS